MLTTKLLRLKQRNMRSKRNAEKLLSIRDVSENAEKDAFVLQDNECGLFDNKICCSNNEIFRFDNDSIDFTITAW